MQQQKYTVGIFGGFYTSSNDFSGWKHTDSITIRASSLEQSIELSRKRVRQKLSQQYNVDESKIEIIINYVKDSDNKVLYQTAWDELSPLSSAFLK